MDAIATITDTSRTRPASLASPGTAVPADNAGSSWPGGASADRTEYRDASGPSSTPTQDEVEQTVGDPVIRAPGGLGPPPKLGAAAH
jgi:hypothetical protein